MNARIALALLVLACKAPNKVPAEAAPDPALVDAAKDACRGKDVDLYDALHDPTCVRSPDAGEPAAVPKDALAVTATLPRDHVKQGERATIEIELTNRTDAPLTIVLTKVPSEEESPPMFLGGIDIGGLGGHRRKDAAPPEPPPPPKVDAAASRSIGGCGVTARRVGDEPEHWASLAMIGLLGPPPRAQIEIAPHGRARGHFTWAPIGPPPGKHDPRKGYPLLPLGPGVYALAVSPPIAVGDFAAAAQLTVDP